MTDKHTAILDAAETLFVEQGLHFTTATDIARRAGIAPASLYHWFDSKQAIFDRAILRAWNPAAELPESRPLRSPRGLQRLVWDPLLDLPAQFPALHDAVSTPTFSESELGAIIVEAYDMNIRYSRVLDMLDGSSPRDRVRPMYERRLRAPLLDLRRRYIVAGQAAERFLPHLHVDVVVEMITVNVAFYARTWRRQFPILAPAGDDEIAEASRRDVLVDRLTRAVLGRRARTH